MGPINGRPLLLLLLAAVDSVTAQPAAENGGPDYFNPKNFNPSMAIAMVVLVTAFFLLGFFSIYLRRCASPPLGRGGPDDDDDDHSPLRLGLPGLGLTTYASRSRRTTRGLDRAVLDSFPTMAYADVKAHKEGGNGGVLECAVCLSEFDDGDTLRLLLPRCNHAFHADCIDAWLASHVTCPVCRSVLAPAPDAADALQAAVVVVPVPATDHDGQVVIPPVVVPAADAVAGETTAEEEQRVRREEAAELLRIGSVKRELRTKSSSGHRPAAQLFPRSHTTGHSLAAASSHSPSSSSTTTDSERYTLRLPDHVLREAVAASNLRRSASVHHQTGGGDGTTTRRGFGGVARNGRSVRLGNSGRWPNMSLLARTFSAARMPVWSSVRRCEADGDALAKGAKFTGDDDHGKAAAVEPQCDGGACSLGDHV